MPHNILHCNVPIIKTPPDNFFNTQPDQQTKRTAWMICNLCATADCPLAALLREHESVPLAGALPSRQTNAHSVFCCCVVVVKLLAHEPHARRVQDKILQGAGLALATGVSLISANEREDL